MDLVYHAKDSTDDRVVWIDYWRERTGLNVPVTCPCCEQTPAEPNIFVGAHVRRVEQYALPKDQQRLYVTPTCKECNDKYKNSHYLDKTFLVDDWFLLDITDGIEIVEAPDPQDCH